MTEQVITLVASAIDCVAGRFATEGDLVKRIDNLDRALEELIEVRDDLIKQVDGAELKGLSRTNQVKGWLARVGRVETEARQMIDQMRQKKQVLFCCDASCCLRYERINEADEKLAVVRELKGRGRLEVDLADGLLLVPVVEVPNRPTVGMELMLDRVGILLRDETVGMLGIYGMGGVGKTTLLKCINNGFLNQDHDFDVIIWVVVSRDFMIEKIQRAIGERLGLSWDETQFQELRASRIHSVMRKRKFLLLLDDVWGGLDLDNVGIPIPSQENGSKVIFTTRSMEVCSYMDADDQLKVEFLSEMESWELFCRKIGKLDILSTPLIKDHAKTIVQKCGGLPLALITMGRAMANKKVEEEWRHAVEALHKTPSDIQGMEDVFTLLKFSYDNLGNDVLRSCLVYCSLFPEDCSIEKEQLIEYWAGEGFLDGYQHRDPHAVGHSIIGSLRVACFLQSGEEESQVKMHDVVRSFTLWIVSEQSRFIMQASEGLTEAPSAERLSRAERVSLLDNAITKLSGTPICPNLSTLFLQLNKSLTKISDGYFQNMPALKVLDLSFTGIKQLPLSIYALEEIRHLDLSGTRLRALPAALGSLKNLRHLNVQRNQNLTVIPRDALLQMCRLRALNFYYSYSGWEMEQFEGSSQLRLKDLEQMDTLQSLGITVANVSALSVISSSKFLRSCIQYLYIKECEGLHYLPLSSHPGDGDQLRRLSINNCVGIKHLVVEEAAGQCWLPKLEILALNGLPNLISIWKNRVGDGCLVNLRSVNIWYCHKLKHVSWILRLPQLETVYIFYCKMMEEVIRGEDAAEEDYKKVFPKLKTISIRDAPQLRSICQKAISFQCLKKIAVIDCPNLRKLPLKAHNVAELPIVYCYKAWWDDLVWDDSDTKDTFLPYFIRA
ncbi:disease resistance protein RPS2 isoform X2 [Andrographis paniculata]|uniref:disease resistance protein RPS2 isoform X2 n=1 Tax=Andrographis paniculata TaxID=175694 RepID=UPI0021E7A8B3|nr:disease resistance protein RPS2 isoform X2 [Andrographis paniculata]